MKIIPGEIDGLLVVQLDIFKDDRGFFVERFNRNNFAARGLPTEFPQDNHSRSKPGVIRGLHYQHDPAQGKFVGVLRGNIWDVAVDIRPNSPTFGKHMGVELSGSNGMLLWIPPGFAHGFCVLGNEEADVLYQVTSIYNAKGEGGIAYNDPEFGIKWPVKNPVISDRDKNLPSFSNYKKSPPKW